MSKVKDLWQKLMLQLVHYRDRHSQLDLFYCVPDPWDMASEREQYRFQESNRIIREYTGEIESLLEVGCGEGHQSTHLSTICKDLYGIDISGRAIARAKAKCTNATFRIGTISDLDQFECQTPFDVAVACEILYYVEDVALTIQQLSKAARVCFVTYYQGHADRLRPFFENLPDRTFETITTGDIWWEAVVWRNRESV